MAEVALKVNSMMFYDFGESDYDEVVLVAEDDSGNQLYITLQREEREVEDVFLSLGELNPDEVGGFDVDNPPKKIEFNMENLPNPFAVYDVEAELKKTTLTFNLADSGTASVLVRYVDSPELEETFEAKYWTYEESNDLGYQINVEYANEELSISIDVYVPDRYISAFRIEKEV